jgi:hypothetical protein
VETRTAGSASGLGKRTSSNAGTAPQADSSDRVATLDMPPRPGAIAPYGHIMTDSAPTAVTYDGLPVSSGCAHSLGRMTRRAAYDATMSFLRTCTQPVGRA